MPEIFENIEDLYWHEEIKSCKDGYNGGLKPSEIYYCPAMHVNKFTIPNLLSSFTNAGTISENITLKNRRSFYKLSALVDQNELEASTSFDSSKSSLNLFIVGLEANRVGISRILPSMPGIYIIVDNNGRKWVIGTIISPAFATCSLKSAKK